MRRRSVYDEILVDGPPEEPLGDGTGGCTNYAIKTNSELAVHERARAVLRPGYL